MHASASTMSSTGVTFDPLRSGDRRAMTEDDSLSTGVTETDARVLQGTSGISGNTAPDCTLGISVAGVIPTA